MLHSFLILALYVVSGQVHVPAALPPGKEPLPGTNSVAGWVEPTASLDVYKRKDLLFLQWVKPRFRQNTRVCFNQISKRKTNLSHYVLKSVACKQCSLNPVLSHIDAQLLSETRNWLPWTLQNVMTVHYGRRSISKFPAVINIT